MSSTIAHCRSVPSITHDGTSEARTSFTFSKYSIVMRVVVCCSGPTEYVPFTGKDVIALSCRSTRHFLGCHLTA